MTYIDDRGNFLARAILTLAIVSLCATSSVAGKGNGKGGNNDGGGSTTLPSVRYRVDAIPTPNNASLVWVNQISNQGIATGWYGGEGRNAFLYDQPSDEFYDLNQLASLLQQIPANWRFRSAHGINDVGDVVGSLDQWNGAISGFVIRTSLDSNPAHWTVELLPAFGSDHSFGDQVNSQGVVLGRYMHPDGSWEQYIYDSTTGHAPVTFGWHVNLIQVNQDGAINNLGHVAGTLADGTLFLDLDPQEGLPNSELFSEVSYRSVSGVTDDGIICGTARMKYGGRGPAINVAFRHAGVLLPIMQGTATGINSHGDVGIIDESWENAYLAYTGTAAQNEEQIWNVNNLVAESGPDLPHQDMWFNCANRVVWDVNDRDTTTQFGQLLGASMAASTRWFGSYPWCGVDAVRIGLESLANG